MRLPAGFLLLFIERDDKYFIASKNEEPYNIQDYERGDSYIPLLSFSYCFPYCFPLRFKTEDNEDYLISSSNETVFKAVRSLEQSFNIIKKHLS